MTENQLLEEANRLTRPCVHLVSQQTNHDDIAAVWKGPGVVPAPAGPYRHWLSINCKFLPNKLRDSQGCLSIYTNEDDCSTGTVAINTSQSIAVQEGAIPLFAPGILAAAD